MHDATGSPLAAWDNFYIIIGSSAAALIGLQFVVIALLTEVRRRSTTKEIDAFATPTILHFCAVLRVSSILNAPWPSLSGADLALGICGGVGVGTPLIVIRRARAQTSYKLVMEDWIWHIVLPSRISHWITCNRLMCHAGPVRDWLGEFTDPLPPRL